jgi:hypothetical protein
MKKQISADTTLIWKYVFPGLWIAFMGLGVIATGIQATNRPGWVVFLVTWIIASAYLIWFARRLKFVSMDEDFLYVWSAFKETQIPLAHIQRVKENFLANPKLITLTLNQPSEFGTQIVFVPTSQLFAAFRSHPIVKEIERAVQRSRGHVLR